MVYDRPIHLDDADHAPTLSISDKGMLANDTDPNGDTHALTIASHTDPSHGTLTLNDDGTFTYTAKGE